MRGARITSNKGNTQHFTSEIKALNELKNYLDTIMDEDIELKLECWYEKNQKLKFDIIAYKGDWCYGKVGTLELLK